MSETTKRQQGLKPQRPQSTRTNKTKDFLRDPLRPLWLVSAGFLSLKRIYLTSFTPSNPSRHSQHPIFRAEKRHSPTAFDFKKRRDLILRAGGLVEGPTSERNSGKKNERLGDTHSLFDCVNGRVAVPLLGFSGLGAGVGHYADGRVLSVLC